MSETTPPLDVSTRSELSADIITNLWVAAEKWCDLHGYTLNGFITEARTIFGAVMEAEGFVGEPHWLYRIYDVNDRLLYVGITRNLDARLASHQRWLGDLFDRYDADEYPDRQSVLLAEAKAIDQEHPAFNVDHPKVDE